MKSKLTIKAFLFPLLAIYLIIVSIKIIVDNYPIDFFELRWIDYFITILISVTLVWLIKFEILKKMIFIEISDPHFVIHNITLNKNKYHFNDLIGFKTQINSTRLGNFEETILLTKNNNKIVLSHFFLDNYKDLKIILTNELKNYGGAMY